MFFFFDDWNSTLVSTFVYTRTQKSLTVLKSFNWLKKKLNFGELWISQEKPQTPQTDETTDVQIL